MLVHNSMEMKAKDIKGELRKIDHKSMADIAEIRIREFLKNEAFKVGDSLPKETDIAESLGVSRNVVREALSRLRMLGIVETKRRTGMVMANMDVISSFERVMDPTLIGEATLRDLFELRLTLEMGLADMIWLRKRGEDIDELHAIASRQELSGDKTFVIQHEIEFHGKLYQMTGNDTMMRFQNLLLPIFEYVNSQEQVRVVGKATHLDLVELLQKGDKEAFRRGMYLHLEPHFMRVGTMGK
jgi:GntR family transcriptional repressor for pyruvate dehydrogenase complex